MKSFLVIGMGRFGRTLAEQLLKLGNDVMIADSNEKIINELAPKFTDSHIGDCTNEAVIRALDVKHMDTCFVAVGEDFQSSLMITSLLKRAGAKRVISKANRDIQADLLRQIGADETIYAEREVAERLAVRCNANHIYDFVPLTDDFSMCEIPALSAWIGNSISDLNIRRKHRVSVVAVKSNDILQPMPSADYVFRAEDHVVVIGKINDVFKLTGRKK